MSREMKIHSSHKCGIQHMGIQRIGRREINACLEMSTVVDFRKPYFSPRMRR